MSECVDELSFGNVTSLELNRMSFVDSDPVRAIAFTSELNPTVVGNFVARNVSIEGGLAAGIVFHGGYGRLKNIDISGCAGPGIDASHGTGFLELENVRTTGADNGITAGEGLEVNDGLRVTVDALTSAATVGANKALTGAGGVPGMVVGAQAFRSFADFLAGAGRPVKDEQDLDASLVTGFVTGSGSRVSQP